MTRTNLTVKLDEVGGKELKQALDEWRLNQGYAWKSLILTALLEFVDDPKLRSQIDSHISELKPAGRPTKETR